MKKINVIKLTIIFLSFSLIPATVVHGAALGQSSSEQIASLRMENNRQTREIAVLNEQKARLTQQMTEATALLRQQSQRIEENQRIERRRLRMAGQAILREMPAEAPQPAPAPLAPAAGEIVQPGYLQQAWGMMPQWFGGTGAPAAPAAPAPIAVPGAEWIQATASMRSGLKMDAGLPAPDRRAKEFIMDSRINAKINENPELTLAQAWEAVRPQVEREWAEFDAEQARRP